MTKPSRCCGWNFPQCSTMIICISFSICIYSNIKKKTLGNLLSTCQCIGFQWIFYNSLLTCSVSIILHDTLKTFVLGLLGYWAPQCSSHLSGCSSMLVPLSLICMFLNSHSRLSSLLTVSGLPEWSRGFCCHALIHLPSWQVFYRLTFASNSSPLQPPLHLNHHHLLLAFHVYALCHQMLSLQCNWDDLSKMQLSIAGLSFQCTTIQMYKNVTWFS